MNPNFSTEPFSKKITKPWGEEYIFTPEGLERTGKILLVKAGKRLSFQYHDEKEETLSLFSGEALFLLENAAGEIEKIPMQKFSGYTVRIGQKHRIEAIQDSYLIEVSSPEKGTTVRIEDDFDRNDETEDIRREGNRGWNG